MAAFAGTLRGDGLARAQRALVGLERDPERLDRARTRFDNSPPPYTSERSGTTTRSQSPDPLSDEQRRLEERRGKLAMEREASLPYRQFARQVQDERVRLWDADPTACGVRYTGPAVAMAEENVKKRWVEQGIWNDKWDHSAHGLWKHEEPLEVESEPESDSEPEPSPPPMNFFFMQPQPQPPKPKPSKSDIEKKRIKEQRVIQKRNREASRPYHQFFYQISTVREEIQEGSGSGEGGSAPDINTTAYETVKNTWIKRGIWNKRWGMLPGMLWKHEEPVEEEVDDAPAPVPADQLANGNHSPFRPLFGSPPVESNHRQASGPLNCSQRGPSAENDVVRLDNGIAEDHDPARLVNGNGECSPSAPNSPRQDKQFLQASRPNKRNSSHKKAQPASASLGPVHLSKVSKAAVKKKPGPKRRLIPPKVSSPQPDSATPRRSKRLQPPVSSLAKDPAKTASTTPSKPAARSRPERKVAQNLTTGSPAKPQGVSKKATRGKGRKR